MAFTSFFSWGSGNLTPIHQEKSKFIYNWMDLSQDMISLARLKVVLPLGTSSACDFNMVEMNADFPVVRNSLNI